MNTFDGRCGSCVHMNTNDYVRTKDHCKCTYRGQYYDLNEPKCRYYEYDKYIFHQSTAIQCSTGTMLGSYNHL